MGQYAFHPDGRPWDTSYPACGSFYSGSLSHPPDIVRRGIECAGYRGDDHRVTNGYGGYGFGPIGMDHSGYKFSRNLLADQVIPFAFFSYPNGAGVVTEKGSAYFSLQSQTFVEKDSVKEDGRLLKAYLQAINEDFNRQ